MNDLPIRVLLVEDDPGDARLIREMLADAKDGVFRLDWVDRLTAGLERLSAQAFSVLLLDLSLPDSQGLATFESANSRAPQTPIIVLTGLDDNVFALEAMRAGAQDYLIKGRMDGDLLTRAIRYAIERKRAEEALRQSEARFRALVEKSSAAITLLDANGTILFRFLANPPILGYAPGALVGSNAFALIHPDDRSRVMALFAQLVQTPRASLAAEFRIQRQDGTWCWVESVATNLLTDASVRAVVVNQRDITERKRAETQLAEQLDELRRWHAATLGREMRVLNLKREVNDLLAQAGQPPRYPSAETHIQQEENHVGR
jgi:PAS domain S-box-containing protein